MFAFSPRVFARTFRLHDSILDVCIVCGLDIVYADLYWYIIHMEATTVTSMEGAVTVEVVEASMSKVVASMEASMYLHFHGSFDIRARKNYFESFHPLPRKRNTTTYQ